MLALDLTPGGLSEGEKQRLRELARRNQAAAAAEIDAARAKSWGKLWERTPEPPPPPPVAPPPSHVGRWHARQQERGHGLGR